MRDCKHGRLARSCEVCDLEQQVQVLTSTRTIPLSTPSASAGFPTPRGGE